MPKTQSILEEELRRGGGSSAGWPWRLLIMTIILLAFTAVVFFGLELGYKPFVIGQISGFEEEMKKLDGRLSKEDKESLLLFYSRLNNINNLLKEQPVLEGVFSLLERTAIKDAYYRAVRIDAETRSVSLDGVSRTYKALTEQLAVLKNDPGVLGVDLKGSQLNRELGGVTFSVAVTLIGQETSQ